MRGQERTFPEADMAILLLELQPQAQAERASMLGGALLIRCEHCGQQRRWRLRGSKWWLELHDKLRQQLCLDRAVACGVMLGPNRAELANVVGGHELRTHVGGGTAAASRQKRSSASWQAALKIWKCLCAASMARRRRRAARRTSGR